MKKIFFLAILFLVFSALPMQAENEVIWETLGNRLDANGNTSYLQRFTVTADSPFEGFAYCVSKRGMTPLDSTVSIIEILPGYYQINSPRFENITPNDTVVIDILTSGIIRNKFMVPDGLHFVKDGKPLPAKLSKKRITSFREQWVDPKTGYDYMTYGNEAYIINDSLKSAYRATPYNQIPTPKDIKLSNKKVSVANLLQKEFVVEPIEDSRIDYALINISDKGVNIKTNSSHPKTVVDLVKRRIAESADESGNVPFAVIEDWADYPYRGVMLDVARNFQTKEDVKTFIDLMSRYGLNVLHFHLGEDEAWRVEMPSLPELTAVGSRRGYTLTDDVPFLKGIYSGDGNPDSGAPANGFYTVDDYIEILRYADSKGVTVIPEIDTPGHSRAAIRSMEWRYKKTGDDSLRLIHDGDTSQYSTAQDFHDNLMNPALEGPYRFMEIVFDDIIDIYNKAGVPLLAINIGGDEVPQHAWDGSSYAQALMREKGMTHQRELHAYFVERLAEIARKKGVKIAGWEEIATGHTPEYDQSVMPVVEAVNSWTYSDSGRGIEMAQKGYPVILSNVDYLYIDQHQSGHPDEQGLAWGGIVTEFEPLYATIDTLMPADENAQANVHGISGHIWAETIKDFGMVQRFLLPRILGLAERAHNKKETLSENEYFGLITAEMPLWNDENLQYYVRQPGIIVKDNTVYMNEPYGSGEIRYTTDGSEPDETSLLYSVPFPLGDSKELRAKLFVGNSASNTSILFEDMLK